MKSNNDWRRFLAAFFITAFLFAMAFFLSNFFNSRKIQEIRSIQDSIAVDILSSETQYNLLSELSCNNVDDSLLSKELNELASKIEYGEQNSIGSKSELLSLRKYYSLLQIKDYLLMKKAEEKCGFKTTNIIYFYSNKEDCGGCEKQGYILTDIRQNYPNVRVYAFDYNLDLSALTALKTIYKVKDADKLPALVINGKVYYGLQEFEDIQKIAPTVFVVPEENASSTKSTIDTKSLKASDDKGTATTTSVD